jgi:hypothetical protein
MVIAGLGVNACFGVESGHWHAYRCAMPFSRKIILHVPVSDEGLLEGFVEQCLVDEVSLVAVVGLGCQRVEDIIDEIVVGDGDDQNRFLCTSSHPNEPYDDVLNMVETWEFERDDPVQEVRL